ncbi:hypothetical protein [Ornithinibacillus halophilus]|uniref:Uncharacterized protein n=1 Tax=Ornithinibacillus halophilus TaxID=930117 RepID=A0A1M5IPP9_9BACI|nr:hypothetical protein [Ornithinibacillus halophilus]SHG30225.1 hypothetical protein SAMN05216225_102528 [Ornithinibacillus halophilus]
MRKVKGIKIRTALGILVFLVAVATTATHLYISIRALETSLSNNYLQNNLRYAQNIADSTEILMSDIQET